MYTKYCYDKEKLLGLITGYGYSPYVLNKYIYYIHQLEEYTEFYHCGMYSHQVGLAWTHETIIQGKIKYRNRIVGMLRDIRLGQTIKPGTKYYLNPIINICPEKFKVLLHEYINYIRKLGYCETTIKPLKKCIIVFLQYMDSMKIKDLRNLNITIMNQFILEAFNRYSLNTKKNYFSIIRVFFTYLAEQSIIPEKYVYYCPSIKNIPDKVPSILSSKVQKALQNLNEPTSEIEARDNAILLLTYRLGLRRSDTLSLKLSKIDWSNKCINILQQKTLVPLKLPLPADVGNALSLYICNFRKNIKGQSFIFLTISPPIRPLNYSASGATVERFQKRYGLPEEIHGLHICRRTCASNILNAGNTTEIVSTILGHASRDSINSYISLDKEKMRLCAINTSLIGYPEVLND
jgi:site-specific recombinase XerD